MTVLECSELLELCMWISDYYEAAPGEVIKAALPTGSSVHAKLLVELTEKGERSLAGEGGRRCDASGRVQRSLYRHCHQRCWL